MRIKKIDYIITYVIVLIFFAWNLMAPVKYLVIVTCLIIALIVSLIVGTLTNLVA